MILIECSSEIKDKLKLRENKKIKYNKLGNIKELVQHNWFYVMNHNIFLKT